MKYKLRVRSIPALPAFIPTFSSHTVSEQQDTRLEFHFHLYFLFFNGRLHAPRAYFQRTGSHKKPQYQHHFHGLLFVLLLIRTCKKLLERHGAG
jgi:hypothetical protein